VFNEVNSGEIYLSTYENQAGQPVTETGFKSLNATLNYLNDQTDVNIENVDIYDCWTNLPQPVQTTALAYV